MNELETIVFHDYNILIQDNTKQSNDWSDNESVESFEDDVDDPDDILSNIYSDQHRWDTVVPFLSYRFRPDIWCTSYDSSLMD